MDSFASRTVIVTGALGGIGLEVTSLLSTLGAQVIALDNKETSEAEQVLKKIPGKHPRYFQVELTDSQAVTSFINSISAEKPDSLVALAGVVVSGELVDQSEESIRRVIDVNLVSQIELSKHLIKHWLNEKSPGNIVFVSSWVDHVPWPGITPYAASKAGLVGVCRGIAREYARQGIRANLIAPGIVDVGMAAKQWREEPDYRARASRAIPLGRLQKPDEVAKGVAFLLSDDASYMTGSTLLMDGGASLYPMDPEEVTR
ncbi:MAG: SDR family oxidoreductase [Actinomycetales bacterium]|nr:SDR family oxidoreductase [Actinomycetales bacterium]